MLCVNAHHRLLPSVANRCFLFQQPPPPGAGPVPDHRAPGMWPFLLLVLLVGLFYSVIPFLLNILLQSSKSNMMCFGKQSASALGAK